MADKSKGWILLYRSIRDSWIWHKKPFDPARAWIDLILDANHEDKKISVNGRLVKIKRGQKWTSLRVLSERWGWRQERVLRFLRTLEEDGMITRNATPSGTLLTIVNYGNFQDTRSAKRSTTRSTGRSTTRSETKNEERTNKRMKKEEDLPSEEKQQPEDEGDTSWFDSLEEY